MKWIFADKNTDEVAEWWDQRPCNVKHSDEPVGSYDYSHEVTRRKYRAEPHIPGFMQAWRWSDQFVLEVGCGIGTDTLEFARHGAHIFAFDISHASTAVTRQRLAAERLHSGVHVDTLNVEDGVHLNFIPHLIYSFGVLHHTPHPDVALESLRAISLPERTELRIMLYHRWSTKGLHLGLTDRRIARGSEARRDSPVTYAFSRRRARRLLESTGWEIEAMWVDHIFPYDVETYKRGEFVLAFPWRYVPSPVLHCLSRLVGWHLLIVARPAEGIK